jgi:hypothetical protein
MGNVKKCDARATDAFWTKLLSTRTDADQELCSQFQLDLVANIGSPKCKEV